MTARVANIICITQLTFEFVHNALLITKRGFRFLYFHVFQDLSTSEDRLQVMVDLPPKIVELFTFWSLKGKVIRTGLFVGNR